MEPFSYITSDPSRGLRCDEPLQLQAPLGQKEQEVKEKEIKSDITDITHSLQHENQQSRMGYGSKTSGDLFGTGATAVPEVPLLISTAPDGFSATQSSRRARNTQHRPNDVEFAFEIGSSLLAELRRLQTVVTEDEKAIQDFKRAIEELTIALRRQESNAEKYKDEIRTLEVKNTDLQIQLSEAHSNAQHAKSETDLRETSDARKDKAERLVENLRAKHETDLVQTHMNQTSEKKDSETALVALKAKDIAPMREIQERLCCQLFLLCIILLLLCVMFMLLNDGFRELCAPIGCPSFKPRALTP